MFCHSLRSDWNHGNAHFLRGIVTELMARGHQVQVYEPRNGWSLQNLLSEHGEAAIAAFQAAYPELDSIFYEPAGLDLEQALRHADLVLVHEWNDPDLVQRIGEHHAQFSHYRLLFHDTHHRSVSDRAAMAAYDLTHYDGVLAFGQVIRDRYLTEGWTQRAWVWHEAADTRVFHPRSGHELEGDLVWIGNWGDDERTAELHEFLIQPVKALGLKARVYGVRYPAAARAALAEAGIEYAGWLPNFKVPEVFSRFRVTVHVPRRPYVEMLPGIPTIRVFEALACGIPLICSPWSDRENLFTVGRDFAMVATGAEMQAQLQRLLHHPEQAEKLAQQGLQTIQQRHTCAHRVEELLNIYAALNADQSQPVEVA